MRKRILCSISIFASIILTFTACGSLDNQQSIVENTIVNDVESQTSTQTMQIDEAILFENDINIMEDNYRNYYEIFVGSFRDSNGDGIGDFKGIVEELDYIQDLGFNGIWLTPIMPSPTYHKYDVLNYCAVDSEFGTMEDFELLINECHERNIRLIIDLAINHTSSKHDWFAEAKKYLSTVNSLEEIDLTICPYADYYHFSNEKLNETYYPLGNSPFYYEGSFWSEMPDLKLESELVRKEIQEVADFWIGKGIDGFRMDAALHYSETDHDLNKEVLQWLYTYCKVQNPEFYMVSEVWSDLSTITTYYGSMTPSIFNFDVANAEGKLIRAGKGKYKAANLVQNMLDYQNEFSAQNPDFIDAPFLSNHDTGRISNALQKNLEDMKFSAGLLLSMSGSPFVYYGEEIGMASSGKKDENKRLPMLWTTEKTEGMTNGPKDADQNIVSAFPGVEEQLKDEGSLLNYYKKALRLRNENPEIARGTISIVEELTLEHQAVITKTYKGSEIIIIYNTSSEAVDVSTDNIVFKDKKMCGFLTVNDNLPSLEEGKITIPEKCIVYYK